MSIKHSGCFAPNSDSFWRVNLYLNSGLPARWVPMTTKIFLLTSIPEVFISMMVRLVMGGLTASILP